MVSQKLDDFAIRELAGIPCNEDMGSLSEEIVDLIENQNLMPPMREWDASEAEVVFINRQAEQFCHSFPQPLVLYFCMNTWTCNFFFP